MNECCSGILQHRLLVSTYVNLMFFPHPATRRRFYKQCTRTNRTIVAIFSPLEMLTDEILLQIPFKLVQFLTVVTSVEQRY